MYNFFKSFTLFLFLVPALGWVTGFPAAAASFSAQQQERILLHQDRDIYVAGENVFFKMQVLAAEATPGNSSRIANLVLRNAQSRNVLQLSVQLDANGAWSAFVLPDTLSSGYYQLVAFTNHMRNEGEEHFFRKQLFVANRFDQEVRLIESFNKGYQALPVSFFPEGGTLINGVPGKVAVVAAGSDGLADRTAWLTTHLGDTLDQVVFQDPDLSVFSFTPEAEKSYFLLFDQDTRVALPPVAPEGCGITPGRQQGQVALQLHPSFGQPGNFFLEVLGADHTPHQRQLILHNQPLNVLFAPEELPQGVLHFVLRDDQQKVVGQRLWYNKSQHHPALEVELMGKATTGQQVPFRVRSQAKEPVPVSVAVVQRGLCFDLQKKILNQLLLKENSLADLQQLAVEAASGRLTFDFNDLLMAARVVNNPLLKAQSEGDLFHVQEVNGFNLSGKLVDEQSGEGIPHAVIYLSTPDTLLNFDYATTLEDGSFYFLLDEYYHGRELILQVAEKQLAQSARIRVFDRFALTQPFHPVVFAEVDDHLEAIVSLQKIVAVQKVYGQRAEVVSHSSDLPLIIPQPLFHAANQVVVPAEYVALDNFREIAREIIFPLRIRTNADGSVSAALVNERARSYFEEAPMFFLDAVPVDDLSQIMELSSDELQRIDVHNIPWIFGELSFDGIISLVSKNKKYEQLEFPPATARVLAPGFSPRLVLQHQADDEAVDHTLTPDFRPLLAWLPALKAQQQPLDLSFVCSDLKGDYMIIVRGVTPQGSPQADFLFFEVK